MSQFSSGYYQSLCYEEPWRKQIEARVQTEITEYREWLNRTFKFYNNQNENSSRWLYVDDLRQDLVDGLRLLYLIEILYKESLLKEYGLLKLHKVRNFETCLSFLRKKRNVECWGISPLSLIETRNIKMMLALLFHIRNNYETTVLTIKSIITNDKHQSRHSNGNKRCNCSLIVDTSPETKPILTTKSAKDRSVRRLIQKYKKMIEEEELLKNNKLKIDEEKTTSTSNTISNSNENDNTRSRGVTLRQRKMKIASKSMTPASAPSISNKNIFFPQANVSQRSKSYGGTGTHDFLTFPNSHGYFLAKSFLNLPLNKQNNVDIIERDNPVYHQVNNLVQLNTKTNELYTIHLNKQRQSIASSNDTNFKSEQSPIATITVIDNSTTDSEMTNTNTSSAFNCSFSELDKSVETNETASISTYSEDYFESKLEKDENNSNSDREEDLDDKASVQSVEEELQSNFQDELKSNLQKKEDSTTTKAEKDEKHSSLKEESPIQSAKNDLINIKTLEIENKTDSTKVEQKDEINLNNPISIKIRLNLEQEESIVYKNETKIDQNQLNLNENKVITMSDAENIKEINKNQLNLQKEEEVQSLEDNSTTAIILETESRNEIVNDDELQSKKENEAQKGDVITLKTFEIDKNEIEDSSSDEDIALEEHLISETLTQVKNGSETTNDDKLQKTDEAQAQKINLIAPKTLKINKNEIEESNLDEESKNIVVEEDLTIPNEAMSVGENRREKMNDDKVQLNFQEKEKAEAQEDNLITSKTSEINKNEIEESKLDKESRDIVDLMHIADNKKVSNENISMEIENKDDEMKSGSSTQLLETQDEELIHEIKSNFVNKEDFDIPTEEQDEQTEETNHLTSTPQPKQDQKVIIYESVIKQIENVFKNEQNQVQVLNETPLIKCEKCQIKTEGKQKNKCNENVKKLKEPTLLYATKTTLNKSSQKSNILSEENEILSKNKNNNETTNDKNKDQNEDDDDDGIESDYNDSKHSTSIIQSDISDDDKRSLADSMMTSVSDDSVSKKKPSKRERKLNHYIPN
jgi:hypothetical protein